VRSPSRSLVAGKFGRASALYCKQKGLVVAMERHVSSIAWSARRHNEPPAAQTENGGPMDRRIDRFVRELLVIQKASQLPGPARMLQFPQRLGLDLADALAGDRE
jgi:hypothetical protein